MCVTNFSEIFLDSVVVFEGVVEVYRTAVRVQHVRVIDVHVRREASQIAEVREQVQKKENSTEPHPAVQNTMKYS